MIVCPDLSVAVVWGLKLSHVDAISAVRADGEAYQGLICEVFFSDSSVLHKWPVRVSGCLSGPLFIFHF